CGAPFQRRLPRSPPHSAPPHALLLLDRPHLLAAGDTVGLPQPGAQRRPLLPRRRRPPDRPPRVPGAEALLRQDRRLLPGPRAPAREVLLRGGLLGRPRPGQQGPSRLAVEGPAR